MIFIPHRVVFFHRTEEPAPDQCGSNGTKAICPSIDSGTLLGEIPAKVSVMARAKVTAGLANDVEDVNQ